MERKGPVAPLEALPPDHKLTYEDYARLPDDGKRYQVVDGVLHVSSAPREKHQRVLMNLAWLLMDLVKEAGLGRVYCAPFDFLLGKHDIVQPDLVFLSNENLEILTELNAQGAPDLAIEILSPSTRRLDEILKRRLYERVGVREYWMIDPELETLRILRPDAGGRFEVAEELIAEYGATLASPLLPGLAVDLARLFE